jgi:hypothetical protein
MKFVLNFQLIAFQVVLLLGEKQNYVAEAKEFRQIAAMSEVLVKEFGEDPDDKGGMLLAQAVQAVVTKRALDELTNTGDDENPQMDIDDVGALARAARAAIMTKEKQWKTVMRFAAKRVKSCCGTGCKLTKSRCFTRYG